MNHLSYQLAPIHAAPQVASNTQDLQTRICSDKVHAGPHYLMPVLYSENCVVHGPENPVSKRSVTSAQNVQLKEDFECRHDRQSRHPFQTLIFQMGSLDLPCLSDAAAKALTIKRLEAPPTFQNARIT